MYISILLPSIFALFAVFKKKVTNGAAILAWIFGFIITYYGGIIAFIALALTFILTILSDKIKKTSKDGSRNVYQIISNVLTPTLCIVLYHFTNNNMFDVMYYAVIASSLADTLASSIGTLSTKDPVNIFTLKRVKPGESGAVSFLGLNASALGGIIIGLVYYIKAYNVTNYLLIILMSVVGSLADSILGITLQAKYKCSKCHKEVEESTHCNKQTKLISGCSWIDNDVVNLLNNIIVFLLSYIFLI